MAVANPGAEGVQEAQDQEDFPEVRSGLPERQHFWRVSTKTGIFFISFETNSSPTLRGTGNSKNWFSLARILSVDDLQSKLLIPGKVVGLDDEHDVVVDEAELGLDVANQELHVRCLSQSKLK